MTNRKSSLYSTANLDPPWNLHLDIHALESRIDELITLCDALERKHSSLEADRAKWREERTRLLEKNDQARAKIEAMIMRLKSLEQD